MAMPFEDSLLLRGALFRCDTSADALKSILSSHFRRFRVESVNVSPLPYGKRKVSFRLEPVSSKYPDRFSVQFTVDPSSGNVVTRVHLDLYNARVRSYASKFIEDYIKASVRDVKLRVWCDPPRLSDSVVHIGRREVRPVVVSCDVYIHGEEPEEALDLVSDVIDNARMAIYVV